MASIKQSSNVVAFEPCQWIIKDLKKSGLTWKDIDIFPLENQSQLIKYLGFDKFKQRSLLEVGGCFYRYPNNCDYVRLKLKEEIEGSKYLSPRGSQIHPYILEEVFEIAIDYNPDKPLIFTEGEKKAAKATLEGFPAIGIPGVWCFKDSENDFLPELNELKLKHRDCFIVFDSDISQKMNVRHAELRLAVNLINRGAKPICVRLPNNKDGSKNGLDDFLVKYGRAEFKKLLDKYKGGTE